MSSFPDHVENTIDLAKLGFDVSEYIDDSGEVDFSSWNYDELVYILSGVIAVIQRKGYDLKEQK